MALPVQKPLGSAYRFLYSGPVGVAGVNVTQSWDISSMPEYIRRIESFKDSWQVFVRQVDPDVSNVDKNVSFEPDPGTPERIVLSLTSSNAAAQVDVEFCFFHSTVR